MVADRLQGCRTGNDRRFRRKEEEETALSVICFYNTCYFAGKTIRCQGRINDLEVIAELDSYGNHVWRVAAIVKQLWVVRIDNEFVISANDVIFEVNNG
jgi:hypothetical protein